MRSVRENMYHAKDCRARLDFLNEGEVAYANTICAGTSTRRANLGDSGGPLVVAYPETGATQWLQVGVVQRAAINSDGTHVSAVYARVASYVEWIRKTTNGAVSFIAAPYPDDPEEIMTRIREVQAQILTLRTTVQSLRNNRTLLKQRIDEFKGVEGQDKHQQTTEDGILASISAILPQ